MKLIDIVYDLNADKLSLFQNHRILITPKKITFLVLCSSFLSGVTAIERGHQVRLIHSFIHHLFIEHLLWIMVS